MRIRVIRVSPRFERHYRKLSVVVREKAKERESLFRENPFHPQLKTHKLSGATRELWSFSVDYTHRITFIFLTETEVLFIDIGTHHIYD